MIRRLQRDTALACVAMSLLALLAWPRTWAAAGGVLGGGVLVGISFWALGGVTRFSLVKTFTRHAILALAGYGMMARFGVDPVALLIGVTSVGVAAALEAVRVVAGGRARSDR